MSRRSMLLAALTVIMALVALAPAMAQDKIEIQVWIAFSGARLEWAQGVAAEFNELFPQYNVVVVGDRNYEEVLTASSRKPSSRARSRPSSTSSRPARRMRATPAIRALRSSRASLRPSVIAPRSTACRWISTTS